jgi:GNAT superfamily N-acetyltransferase
MQPSPYRISNDRSLLDVALIHDYLSRESYWARGLPRGVLERAIANSLCFGMYESDRQIGFARVVTDAATFGYLADVFIIASHRGRGLGRRLMDGIMAHPDLQGLRRFMLATRDAHGLYRQFGFTAPMRPEVLMEKHDPDVYLRAATAAAAGG